MIPRLQAIDMRKGCPHGEKNEWEGLIPSYEELTDVETDPGSDEMAFSPEQQHERVLYAHHRFAYYSML